MLKIERIKTFDIVVYFECFFIIFLSGNAIEAIEGEQLLYNMITVLVTAVSWLFIFRVKNIQLFVNKLALYTIATAILFVINFINYPDSAKTLLMRILYFLSFLGFTKSCQDRNRDLGKYFYNCIILFAIIVLVYFTAIHILGIKLPYRIVYNTNGTLYYMYSYFYLETFETSNEFSYRLSGFFWEPGVLQIYLNYALYRYLFCDQKKNIACLVLIIVSLVFCFSTAGYLVAMLLLVFKMWLDSKFSKTSKIILSVPIIAVTVFMIILIISTKRNSLDVSSYDARLGDLLIGLKLFFKHFFIGAGFNNMSVYTEAAGRSRGNSNGLIQIMFTMGIAGLTVYVLPFIINFKRLCNGIEKRNYLIYCFFLVITSMTEPMYLFPFVLVLVCIEYTKMSFIDNKRSSHLL